jgi:uncharacterized protein
VAGPAQGCRPDCAVRIQVAQAKYGGYRGMYLQPPAEKDGLWTAIIRFDTAEHFEAWMNSPERAELLSESKVFIEQEQLLRLATSFPGWVPINPLTGKGPPNWKTALLVILGVFPVVMLEIRFLSPFLTSLGFRAVLPRPPRPLFSCRVLFAGLVGGYL